MIYATGDLHGNTLRFQPQYFPEQAGMTKDDYMIVCGDFGCVWNGDKSDNPQLDRLETLPFTVLFLDGNHENFDALNEYPVEQWHGGKVHKIRPHVIHLMRGQAFELQDRTFLTMGGAQSHDIVDGILNMDSTEEKLLTLLLSVEHLQHTAMEQQKAVADSLAVARETLRGYRDISDGVAKQVRDEVRNEGIPIWRNKAVRGWTGR